MKILLATSKAVPSGGGIASYNQELVSALGKDNEIYLLTDADEYDVPGYRLTYRTSGQSNRDYGYCSRLIDKINNGGYDCIINSNSAFIPVISPFLTPRIVSVSHFVDGALAINAGYNAPYQNAIISLSEYGKKFIIDKFHIGDPDKIKVIYNFVRWCDAQPDGSKIDRTPLRIVYPGGTSIAKSVDVVQQLVYRLLRSDLDFEFVWMGGTRLPSAGKTLLGLHETTDLFAKDKRLRITGSVPREEAMDIMASANIFLLPSRGEGCPMTLLEAMRGGCISIVSDARHGSREIIEKSNAGVIVRQGSSRELYEAISDILLNHGRYREMYSLSKEYIEKELSQAGWVTQMYSVIEGLTADAKRHIPLTPASFDKSTRGYSRLIRIERVKTMARSAFYRIKFDISYIRDKLSRH